jgi:hypothetical protein
MQRLFAGTLFCVGAVGLTFFPTAVAAQLAITCPGTVELTFTPPLSGTLQAITFAGSGTFGPCIGVPPLGTPNSATVVFSGSGTFSCFQGDLPQLQGVITWSDSTVSTATADIAVGIQPTGIVTASAVGFVDEGTRFGGAPIQVNATLPNVNIEDALELCQNGVENVAGVATILIGDAVPID